MNQTEGVEFKLRIRLRFLGATFVFATLLSAGCNSHPENRIRLTDTPNVKPAPTFSPRFPQCRGASASVLTGSHKIVLRWNPSTSSSGVTDRSLRYCVYRSETAITAPRRLDCPSCLTITPNPIIGTSCMDNFGDGTKAYYYAATAIDAAGNESIFSNKMTARLSRQPGTSSAATRQAPQPCSAPVDSNTTPQPSSGTNH